MKYPLVIKMDLTVDELYELHLSITKKLSSEIFGRKVTEQKLREWSGKGSIHVDNVLLCELNACEIRVALLEDMLQQIKDAFIAAQYADNRELRRMQKTAEP